MEFVSVDNGSVRLNVAVAGHGPLILCVHGWPELSYSWRHQIAHFAARGYQVAALDVRGYGGSSKPQPVEAYTLRHLALDAAAVIDRLGHGGGALDACFLPAFPRGDERALRARPGRRLCRWVQMSV